MLQVNLALIKGGKIMLFVRKKKTKSEIPKKYHIDEVYVLKTYILSTIDEGTGLGPRSITKFFLAKKEDEKYFELFSNVEIKEDLSYNSPIIDEVKPLTDYISDEYKERTIEFLFDFILRLNTKNIMELIIDIESGGKRDGE